MTAENLITIAICLGAGGYVANSMFQSIRKAWLPKGSGCGGCGDGDTSCSTDAPKSNGGELIQLKRAR